MEEDRLTSIDKKLDVIIRLLALRSIEGKGKTEAIIALKDFGIETNLIADMVGTTPAAVTARLWEQKKKDGAKPTVKQIKKQDGTK